MAAEKGNQYACGTKFDIEAETVALDLWSKRDDATALVQFCCERDIYAQRIYEWRDYCPKFAETLKKAKTRIATRIRAQMQNNTTNYGVFMREIGFHDQFLHDYEEGIKDKDAKRAKSIEEVKVEEIKANLNMFMVMLKQMQPAQPNSSGSSKDLNSDDNSSKADNKS